MGKLVLISVLFVCCVAALAAALGVIALRSYAYLLRYFIDLMGA